MSQTQTDLRIFDASGNEIPLPDGSSAFPTMTLNPISDQVEFVRTTSGKLINLSDAAFQLYEIGLSANWLDLPAIEQMRLDQEFTIHSTIVLKERGTTPSRDAVDGSVVVESGWVEYRPIFYVKLTGKSQSGTEGRDASWSLTFEEVEAFDGGTGGIDYVEATGGQIVDYTDADGVDWRAHIFTASGEFVVTAGGEADVEGIGGGGGGGDGTSTLSGGGGGAGQYYRNQAQKITAGTWPIAIGAGGLSQANGTETSFLGITCLGGGRGARWVGSPGPSGYGGGSFSHDYFTMTPGGTFPCPTPWHRSGNRGGVGRVTSSTRLAGGGGGVSQCGGDAFAGWPNDVYRYDTGLIPGIPYRAGGAGIFTNITGADEHIGGGGGGGNNGTQDMTGGLGGGGNGGLSGAFGGNATGYGSGGGGAWNNATGGTGSDGRVVIRYKRKS